MRALTILTTLAAATYTFASSSVLVPIPHVARQVATPTPTPNADQGGRVLTPLPPNSEDLAARHEGTVPAVLNQLIVDLDIAIAPLTYITKQNCTVASITPVVENVKAIISVAIDECTQITAGVSVNGGSLLSGVIGSAFSLGGQVLSVLDICKILSLLIHIVFTALNCVLVVVGDAEKGVILPLLREVVVALCQLLGLVFGLLGGLLSVLLPMIADISAIVTALDVVDICAKVGISF
ncbi:hypothetical protein L218DRAFT_949532 [Marasmius fiardii PR-910]|nr:hypothetical protein L218DRAFT_949532 [Marasmius fiardii PR-910]